MIRVSKDYQNVPRGLSSDRAKQALELLLAAQNGQDAKGSVYRHKTVLEELAAIYHGKCAYCEGKAPAWAPSQVEHYRPKAGVFEDPNHPGYYWLAYEWSNLLLSCPTCNNAKSKRFPTASKRVAQPQKKSEEWACDSQSLSQENALLLNPEIDTPQDHLIFSNEGELSARGGSARGKATIEICKLNRDKLLEERWQLVYQLRQSLTKQALAAFKLKDDLANCPPKILHKLLKLAFSGLLTELKAGTKPDQRYSMFMGHLFQNFEEAVIEPIVEEIAPTGKGTELKAMLKQAYKLFQNQQA